MNFEGIHEKTLVLVKPDAIQRGLIGDIISRFEKKGMKLVALKLSQPGKEVWAKHYAHIADKPFYGAYEEFITSTPVVAMVWEGLEVVNAVRLITGITKAREAEAGSIRGDFAMSVACNVIHASDSVDNAKVEVERFFNGDELYEYDRTDYLHLYMADERGEE